MDSTQESVIPGCWKWGSNRQTWIQEEHCGLRPYCGTVGQLCTVAGLLGASLEFTYPVYLCFNDLEKAERERSACILATKSNTFLVGVGLHHSCPLSLISRHSRGEENVLFGTLRIALCFLQMMLCWCHQPTTFSMNWGSLQPNVKRLGWESAPPSLRPWFFARYCLDCSLQVGRELLTQVREFKYVRVLNEIANRSCWNDFRLLEGWVASELGWEVWTH